MFIRFLESCSIEKIKIPSLTSISWPSFFPGFDILWSTSLSNNINVILNSIIQTFSSFFFVLHLVWRSICLNTACYLSEQPFILLSLNFIPTTVWRAWGQLHEFCAFRKFRIKDSTYKSKIFVDRWKWATIVILCLPEPSQFQTYLQNIYNGSGTH